jgi:hypothetical protein
MQDLIRHRCDTRWCARRKRTPAQQKRPTVSLPGNLPLTMRVLWQLMSRSLPQILERLMDRMRAEDVQVRLQEFLEGEVSHSD